MAARVRLDTRVVRNVLPGPNAQRQSNSWTRRSLCTPAARPTSTVKDANSVAAEVSRAAAKETPTPRPSRSGSSSSKWLARVAGFAAGTGLLYGAGKAAHDDPEMARNLPYDSGAYLVAGYEALPSPTSLVERLQLDKLSSQVPFTVSAQPSPGSRATSPFEVTYGSIPDYLRPQRAILSPLRSNALYLTIHLDEKADPVECATAAARAIEDLGPSADAALGFSERIWATVQPRLPAGVPLHPFSYSTIEGKGGALPATGGDIYLHFKADDRSACMEAARGLLETFPEGSIYDAEDVYGFRYRDDLDFTGFRIYKKTSYDDSAKAVESRREVATEPTTGGSYMLSMLWRHKLFDFVDMPTRDQEAVFGKTKDSHRYLGNIDLAEHPDKLAHAIDSGLPEDSHVARMIGVDQGGHRLRIVPQSLPTGSWAPGPVHSENTHEAGLGFVAYAQDPVVFSYMLRRMVGASVRADDQRKDRPSDALLRYTRCIRAQLYYAPSAEQLKSLARLQ
ncbi:Hypothetical Protein FCC1311_065242 [Hondaea fermentalgiana]|uniref:Deferrochelatase/peroxidase YfeX n=1 Tax=Hondaea fermentalgiana TaxID=2315210 RepID=A0A2R5GI90_9STRA|nr:Hypothetical Protein FCC1311_065242 [Hondaea fermentalgiana]|eukprot:GBG30305.1 Hypothetical Protein FCC1311_065242 [Hondaea fermentalgiana]